MHSLSAARQTGRDAVPATFAFALAFALAFAASLAAVAGLAGCGGGDPGGTSAVEDDGGAADAGVDAGEAADGATADVTADTTESDGGTDDAGSADAADSGSDDAGADTDAGDDEPPVDWQARFDAVFPADHVIEIGLSFASGDWAALLQAFKDDGKKVYFPAAMTFDDEELAQIGVRLKGNSTMVMFGGDVDLTAKYPLKFNFDKYDGPRFHHVDKVSLGTNAGDYSLMRERLAVRMYQAMGVHAPRTSYARLTVEGKQAGLYTMAQVIDKRFLKERFGTADHADDGNLYKCVYNPLGICLLKWRGPTKADYFVTQGCSEGYETCGLELQTNEDDPAQNDYSDLIHFLDVLEHTPDGQFEAAIAKVLDVDQFLRLTAVSFAISSLDSYFGKGNNYYLYHRVADHRFIMLPWDFNGAYMGGSCTKLYDPTCNSGGATGDHPLAERIMAVPAFRAQYRKHIEEITAKWMTVDQHVTWIKELDALVGPLVDDDPNYIGEPGDYAKATALDAPMDAWTENLVAFVAKRHEDLVAALAAEP